MIFDQAESWRRADAGEDLLEMIVNVPPDRLGIQLLRSIGDPTQKTSVMGGW